MWLWTEALNELTATNRFSAATLSVMYKPLGPHMLTWVGWGGGQRDTSNLFLTRHNDVNAWAFKNKQSESCYRKYKCNINTNIHHTEIHLRKKNEIEEKSLK